MNFYAANTSRQDSQFNFRLPENPKAIGQPIRIGQQVVLGRELSKPEIDALVEQIETYGGVRVGDYTGVKGKVISYLYDIDKEIPRKEIERVMRHNTGQLTLIGKEAREQAAIAVNEAMEKMTPGLVNELEMTVQQDSPPEPGQSQLAEGVIVRDEARRSRNEKSKAKRR
jgi:hypothetical protein